MKTLENILQDIQKIKISCLEILNIETQLNPIYRDLKWLIIIFRKVFYFIFWIMVALGVFFFSNYWVAGIIDNIEKIVFWDFSIMIYFYFFIIFFICSYIFARILSNDNYFSEKRFEENINNISISSWSYTAPYIRYLLLPREILIFNNQITTNIQENQNFWKIYEITNQILIFVENFSKNRDEMQEYIQIQLDYVQSDYVQKMERIILEEIRLLQNILEYSFQNQLKNHEKIISEIENLQNSEWKNFSEILELQKIRLENQKHIFEKILEK